MWPFKRRADSKAEDARVLSLLSPAEISSLGELPGEAVAGILTDGGNTPEYFRVNRAFVDFMHGVIAAAGPKDMSLIAAAQRQESGWIYVIDLRTRNGPQGEVPPEDIIGAFEVRSGKVEPETYQAFPAHQIFTTSGLVQLPPTMRAEFIAELRRRTQGAA